MKTTLCRFRNRLVINAKLEGLLASINEQIESHDFDDERCDGRGD